MNDVEKDISDLIKQNQQLQEENKKAVDIILTGLKKQIDETRRLKEQIAELQAEKEKLMSDFMAVQTNQQIAQFKKV